MEQKSWESGDRQERTVRRNRTDLFPGAASETLPATEKPTRPGWTQSSGRHCPEPSSGAKTARQAVRSPC